MEFTISCPIDGSIDVSIEDIDTVVLRESERADITFVCPHCGTAITVSAIVPAFLLAAIEALADEPDAIPVSGEITIKPVTEAFELEPVPVAVVDDPHADAYCEYFRRQLDHIVNVEDVLAEIDTKG